MKQYKKAILAAAEKDIMLTMKINGRLVSQFSLDRKLEKKQAPFPNSFAYVSSTPQTLPSVRAYSLRSLWTLKRFAYALLYKDYCVGKVLEYFKSTEPVVEIRPVDSPRRSYKILTSAAPAKRSIFYLKLLDSIS